MRVCHTSPIAEALISTAGGRAAHPFHEHARKYRSGFRPVPPCVCGSSVRPQSLSGEIALALFDDVQDHFPYVFPRPAMIATSAECVNQLYETPRSQLLERDAHGWSE